MPRHRKPFNLSLFRKNYQGPTTRVKLVVTEHAADYLPELPFRDSTHVAEYFQSLEDEPKEVLLAVYLNTKNQVLGIEEISRGTLSSSLFDPRAFLQGVLLSNAAGLVVVHNHPSGDTQPSKEDLQVTKSLKEAAALFQTRLLDHIIVGRNPYFSFADRGCL